jgi:hypothetical protein
MQRSAPAMFHKKKTPNPNNFAEWQVIYTDRSTAFLNIEKGKIFVFKNQIGGYFILTVFLVV